MATVILVVVIEQVGVRSLTDHEDSCRHEKYMTLRVGETNRLVDRRQHSLYRDEAVAHMSESDRNDGA